MFRIEMGLPENLQTYYKSALILIQRGRQRFMIAEKNICRPKINGYSNENITKKNIKTQIYLIGRPYANFYDVIKM